MSAAPVEGKVSAGAQGTGAGLALYGFLLWLLGVTLWGQPADAGHAIVAAAAVPAPVIGLLALLPVGLGYACGYLAKHTPRPVDRPVIIKSDATTAPVDGPALKAVIDDLRAALVKPVKITIDGQTVATTGLLADVDPAAAGPEDFEGALSADPGRQSVYTMPASQPAEGRQMTEAGSDTATEV